MNNKSTDGPLVVAIDSSTTSTKAIVVDVNGNVLGTAKRPIQLHTPAMDQYEHNPIRWWETSRDTIGEVISGLSPADRSRVSAIGVTQQRESFAPFKADGTPLRNGILWLDGRATEQIRAYGTDRVHQLSGKPAGVTPAIYKMAWLKQYEPDAFTQADKVIDVGGYICFNLTDRWATSEASADSLGLFDIESRTWADELLEIAGVQCDQMADLVPPADVIGYLRPELVTDWGLDGPIRVVAGLGDGQAAGIGAAAITPDIAYLNLGTAVNAGVESPTYKYDSAVRTLVSGIPGEYVFEVVPTWPGGSAKPSVTRASSVSQTLSSTLLPAPSRLAVRASSPSPTGTPCSLRIGIQSPAEPWSVGAELTPVHTCIAPSSNPSGSRCALTSIASRSRRGSASQPCVPWEAELVPSCGVRSWPTPPASPSRHASRTRSPLSGPLSSPWPVSRPMTATTLPSLRRQWPTSVTPPNLTCPCTSSTRTSQRFSIVSIRTFRRSSRISTPWPTDTPAPSPSHPSCRPEEQAKLRWS